MCEQALGASRQKAVDARMEQLREELTSALEEARTGEKPLKTTKGGIVLPGGVKL